MIRVLGGPKRLCDGLTRRDLLHVGSLGMLGLGLSGGTIAGLAKADTSDRDSANVASYAAVMGITFPSAVTETLLAALGASLDTPVGA